MKIEINNCIGCGQCYDVCEHDAISINSIEIDPNKCINCGTCKDICPGECIYE